MRHNRASITSTWQTTSCPSVISYWIMHAFSKPSIFSTSYKSGADSSPLLSKCVGNMKVIIHVQKILNDETILKVDEMRPEKWCTLRIEQNPVRLMERSLQNFTRLGTFFILLWTPPRLQSVASKNLELEVSRCEMGSDCIQLMQPSVITFSADRVFNAEYIFVKN